MQLYTYAHILQYIYRISRNELARTVKLADLAHNMDLSRIPEPTEKDLMRTARYEKERAFLESKSEEG